MLLPCLATADISAQNPRNIIPPPGAVSVKTLLQNWTDAESETFYNAPQGSKLLPYRWFLALEQAGSNVRFLDVANIQKLGYIARTPGPGNTDGLPVGFTKDDRHVGLTCAACHTQLIVVGDKSLLVDGAPTLADYETFQTTLAASLKDTVEVADKFKRFGDSVLGAAATDAQRDELMTELKASLAVRESYNLRNLSRNSALKYGPGRVDAFGAILNQVSSVAAKLPENHFVADAPVSYPFLWDTPQHDFVQWNGAAPNNDNELGELIFGTKHIGALGRNAGEGSRLKLKEAAPVGYIYKGRPLNGIWATAPYLHNGSVPNIDELLKKPASRTKTFQVGSRVYDKENMGLVSTAGTFLYDTNQPGNSNAGHDYGDTEFSADQRKALIEYLKSL